MEETRQERGSLLSKALLEAVPYINRFAGKTIVIKFGGSTLSKGETVLEDLVLLKNLNINAILVHGGGPAINALLKRVGKESTFVNGLRVTDEETVDIVKMALVGQVNTSLVAAVNALGGRAIGLNGLDGGLLRVKADRRAGDIGFVGEVTAIDLRPLELLCHNGYIPIIAPIGLGEDGQAYNLNADTAAGEIAAALGAEKIIFLSDIIGLLDKEKRLIPRLSNEDVPALMEDGTISGGMIPKIEACLTGLKGARAAHIIDGRVPHALISELFTDHGVGTMITA